jgi:aerobic-type carbon monoxide dehydrogenase small subunit (CoxS/CutS family)
MSEHRALALKVNGKLCSVASGLDATLLTVLRDELHLTAAKRGCNQGVCGACTVSVDGWPMRACLSLAHNCTDASVTTLEGLSADRGMQALQRTFTEGGALQCGFCTPGMLIAAHALLSRIPEPSVEEIQLALSGNLCRCTGYKKIVDAVLSAVLALRSEATP